MLKYSINNQKGDTLIEVLFTTAVFGLVVVGAISIMNQGVNASQRALEISLVRNEIDAQAETLRFLNASYIAAYKASIPFANYPINTPAGQWASMSNNITSGSVSTFGMSSTCTAPASPSFIMDTRLATYSPASGAGFGLAKTFSQVEYNSDNSILSSDGIWIEAAKSGASGKTDYIDFHIRACWNVPGQNNPITLGTIVRLYEPTPQ